MKSMFTNILQWSNTPCDNYRKGDTMNLMQHSIGTKDHAI